MLPSAVGFCLSQSLLSMEASSVQWIHTVAIGSVSVWLTGTLWPPVASGVSSNPWDQKPHFGGRDLRDHPRPAFFEWRCDVAIFRALRPAHTCFGLSIQQSQCKVIENKLKLESIWNLLSRWLFKWGNSQASFELIPEAPSLIWSPAYPPSGRSVWRAVESTENPRY